MTEFRDASGNGVQNAPIANSNLGQQTLTVSSTAVALTVPTHADYAYIRCETANVRWRADGTAPTATVGSLLQAGEAIELTGNLNSYKFIRTSTDATLTIDYYWNKK